MQRLMFVDCRGDGALNNTLIALGKLEVEPFFVMFLGQIPPEIAGSAPYPLWRVFTKAPFDPEFLKETVAAVAEWNNPEKVSAPAVPAPGRIVQ